MAPQSRHPTLTLKGLRQRLSRNAPYLAYRGGAAVARVLPGPVAYQGGRFGGAVMARTMKDRRAMLERHLRRVHGQNIPDSALAGEVRRSFASYARYWVDSFRLPGSTPEELAARMTSEGLENVERGLAAGNGVILALPHLGGWEVGGAWLASLGYRMAAVVENVEPFELFLWFAELRRSIGLEVLPLDSHAGTAVLRRLREGSVVALLCDRDIEGTGVEVEFFGERTTLPGGPAMIALRSGAALVPSAVYFRRGDGHHAVMGTPLDTTRRGRLRDDVTRVTQDLAYALEAAIRRAPDQWHLLQPNWPSDFDIQS